MTEPEKRTDKCKQSALGWFPEIKFAAEETPIKVTLASYNNASKQRILACGESSNADLNLWPFTVRGTTLLDELIKSDVILSAAEKPATAPQTTVAGVQRVA